MDAGRRIWAISEVTDSYISDRRDAVDVIGAVHIDIVIIRGDICGCRVMLLIPIDVRIVTIMRTGGASDAGAPRADPRAHAQLGQRGLRPLQSAAERSDNSLESADAGTLRGELARRACVLDFLALPAPLGALGILPLANQPPQGRRRAAHRRRQIGGTTPSSIVASRGGGGRRWRAPHEEGYAFATR